MADPTPLRELIAVIEVGSSAIRMVIAEIGPKLALRPLETLQKPVSFGKDVFTNGRLSHASIREGIEILEQFKLLLESYNVRRMQAVATSAVREAANKDNFIDQIFVRTGIDVEVIEGAEENRLDLIAVENALAGQFDFDKKNCLIIEVGTGSTEIIVTERGQVVLTRTLLIGPLRLPELPGVGPRDSASLQRAVKRRVGAIAEEFSREYNLTQVDCFIAMGASMRFLCRQFNEHKGASIETLSIKDFSDFVKGLAKLSTEEILERYGLSYAEAESLYASLLIYHGLLTETHATTLLVPTASLRDGILIEMAQLVSGNKRTDLSRQVINSARALGKKYRYDEAHANSVAAVSLRIFDGLKNDHGLGARERLLLEIAGLLHDIGTFISPSSHHKHGYYLINSADLFGLRKMDKDIVANVVRYHRRSLPKMTHLPYVSLPRPERAIVSKLAAILRVGEALDASHQQKCRDLTIERSDDLCTAWVSESAGDLSLERQSLARKSDMMTDVLGIIIALKQGARVPAKT